MRTAIAVSTAGLGLVLSAAVPAFAATGTESVAFTVAAGTLGITPGTAATGTSSALAGGVTTATVALGLSTVTDTRVNSIGWTVGAAVTDFTLASGTSTVAKAHAAFNLPTAPVSALGAPAVTFTYIATPTAVDATGNLASLVVATAVGVNTGTFSPQLVVTIPNGSAVGAYTSTVTQTVV